MQIAAGKDLLGANALLPGLARLAGPARDHGWNDDAAIKPRLGVRPGLDDCAADLVAERQRKRMPGWNAVVVEAEVGVSDAATGHFDENVPGARLLVASLAHHRLPWLSDDPRLDAHGRLPVGAAPEVRAANR